MRRALIVTRREWMLAFESPVAYVTIVCFVVALAALFFFVGYPIAPQALPSLWRGGQAELRTLFAWLPLLLVFLVPALTMGAWAQERSEGTDELLLTYPLRVGEVVVGKFLALWSLVALLLAAGILPIAASVARLGPLDWSTVWVGLLGSWMMAAAYVALALFVSATTRAELVAYILGVILLGGMWLARMLVSAVPSDYAPALAWISPGSHFLESAARGVLDARDLVWFALLTFAGLSWNTACVDRRRGARGLLGLGPQAALASALTLGILLSGNLAAERHLRYRRDLSADQLYGVSAATRAILGELEDTLLVKAYFSGRIESGEWALAKARLEGMLEEYQACSKGRLQLVQADPARSTAALGEARELGIEPRQVASMNGTTIVREPVYLGLALRYRGREALLPQLNPASLELAFASAVHRLRREHRPVVGWLQPAPEWENARVRGVSFRAARAAIAEHAELRPVVGLESGLPVPREVDVLCVVRPSELPARVAYEIDQYVQRGGKLLVCIDVAAIGPDGVGLEQPSGLEAVLACWGAGPSPLHVWDETRAGILIETNVTPRGRIRNQRQVQMPLFLELSGDSIPGGIAATAGLTSASLYWAQPIPPLAAPPGLQRVDLLLSSKDAYRTELTHSIVSDESMIAAKSQSLNRLGKGRAYTLATSLSGRFPSAFEEFEEPPAAAARGALEVRDEREPEGPRPERVRAGGEGGRVLVFGDADWIRDSVPAFSRDFFTPANRALLLNLIDWLALDEALLSLRSRAPRDRSLIDFDELERRVAGVVGAPQTQSIAQVEHRRALERLAAARAEGRRLRAMLVPVGGTLLLVLALGLAWNLRERRRPAPGGAA